MRSFFLLTAFVFYSYSCAQSLSGVNGHFNVPSGYIKRDGYLAVGSSIIPKGNYSLYYNGDKFDGMPSYINLSFFDRIEFMFRYTHQLGQVVSESTQYFPDRMFALRFKVLDETKYSPSLVLGLHDFSEAFGVTTAPPWFLSTYFVGSKTSIVRNFSIITTLGYGFDLFEKFNSQQFKGVFGGIEFSHHNFSDLSMIVEYDGFSINTGFKYDFFNHLILGLGLLNLSDPSIFAAFHFNLR